MSSISDANGVWVKLFMTLVRFEVAVVNKLVRPSPPHRLLRHIQVQGLHLEGSMLNAGGSSSEAHYAPRLYGLVL